jgi:putative transposase
MRAGEKRVPGTPTSRTPPVNPGLLALIRGKRERCWKPTLDELRAGFRGWHQRGYLPHFDAPSVSQMVTFMLTDSFPISRRAEWEPILREPTDSLRRRRLEEWLDRGHGRCWLRLPHVAKVVEHVLMEGDGRDFRMQAWTLMPNHVHLLVDLRTVPLVKLVNHWKGASSRQANLLLGRAGRFWQQDYFDTLIRDSEHMAKALRYVEQNPVKAGLVRNARDWPWSSARGRDSHGRLPRQAAEAQARDPGFREIASTHPMTPSPGISPRAASPRS